MWNYFFGVITAGVLFFVLWITHVWRTRSFLIYVIQTLQAITNGSYGIRLSRVYRSPVQRKLIDVINTMVQSVEEQVGTVSRERDVLEHIVQSMTTGIVYINRLGRIQMANDAVAHIFLRPLEQWVGREHWAVFRPYQIGRAIDDTLLHGTPWRGELKLREDTTVDISLIPIHTHVRNRLGGEPTHDLLMICTDVSEWRRLERMRSEFVANVSHELKTPIAAIRGFAETLLDGEVDKETARAFLETIYEESKRMGMLVSDLLELSKLEGAKTHIQLETTPLRPIIERAVARVRSEAEKRNLTIHTDGCQDVLVWADEHRILQVLLNLLINAIHYTPDGGKITVWCDVYIDKVKIHVEDTGIGIDKEHLPRVFERFYRVDKDRSRASGGTGLGLAIAKHIVNAHGGEIGVDSRIGQGSDFWFTLSLLERTNGSDTEA